MIASLNVENIALIDHLQIDFADGMNVLSGETGAGKSVLLNSMNLILGERAERSLIRHGMDTARVEALVYPEDAGFATRLEELGIPFEEEMLVTRELTASGRSVCRVNGRTVTLATLRDLMGRMVDLHGQHEHQSLLDPARHTALLDEMAQEVVSPIQERILAEWKKLRAYHSEMRTLGGDPAERERTCELLRFQIDEVEGAAISSGELESLLKEQRRLDSAEEMQRVLYQCNAVLYGDEQSDRDVLSGLQEAIRALERYEELDARLPDLLDTYRDACVQLEDTSRDLSTILDSVELDERRAAEVAARIDHLHALLRKYGAADEDALLEQLGEWKNRLSAIEGAQGRSEELSGLVTAQKKALVRLYRDLSDARGKAAETLTRDLLMQLGELGMEDACFEVRFSGFGAGIPVRYGPHSPQSAEFFISVNKGEPLRPLAKVASGGEISRIMLAFKVVGAEHDRIGTLIFDEIDTGISGHTAQVVGEKMAQIALGHQLIVVTHLPQIAVMADRNFYIHKESDEERTTTHIDRLTKEGVRDEMVRLTGGLESAKAQAHARELMRNAKQVKERLIADRQDQSEVAADGGSTHTVI